MPDPIPPPAARRPEEALELVSLALSDGDLEAALAQYERGAVLQPWAAGHPRGGAGLRDALAALMDLRLPLTATVRQVLAAGDVALVLGEREIAGAGPGREAVRFSGAGSTLVRRQPDGTWCIVADAWCLDAHGSPHGSPRASPAGPGEPPRAGGDRRERQG